MSPKNKKLVDLNQIFKTPNPIIGVVHLLPLPTSPRWGGDLKTVIDRAEQEATALASGGVHGIMVENFFDAPFPKEGVDPAVVSAMSLVVQRLMQMVTLPIGINVLRNDARSAMAIATCVQAQFIRVDVLVKHARPLGTPNLTTAVQETIERGLADAVILSGWATGSPPSLEDLELASAAARGTPVFIGSGASWENIPQLIQAADGVIVSSSLKRKGQIEQPIDPNRVGQFVEAMQRGLEPKIAPEEIRSLPTAIPS
jgi:uncharacterized protein